MPTDGDWLETQIGRHVTWRMDKRGKTTEVVGTIDRYERLPGVMMHTDEGQFPAFRVRIKPDDGSRAVWSCSFADRGPM